MSYSSLRIEKFSENSRFFIYFFPYLEASKETIFVFILFIYPLRSQSTLKNENFKTITFC